MNTEQKTAPRLVSAITYVITAILVVLAVVFSYHRVTGRFLPFTEPIANAYAFLFVEVPFTIATTPWLLGATLAIAGALVLWSDMRSAKSE